MNNIVPLSTALTPIPLDAQLPGGEKGFTKWAPITEEGRETDKLEDVPIDPTGTCARMGLEAGSTVAYESFLMEVSGFTIDDSGHEKVVVSLGRGGIAFDYYLICWPEILSPVTEWMFRGSTAPCRIGNVIPDQGQWLYIIRDSRENVIYIGISVNAPTRWKQHQSDKPWFDQAASFERIWFPTRESVEDAERILIAQIRPPYNTVHNPDKRSHRTFGGGGSGED